LTFVFICGRVRVRVFVRVVKGRVREVLVSRTYGKES